MARILHVFRPRTGGTYGHVRVLASELAARGHEVAVCGPGLGAPDDARIGGARGFDVPLYEARIPRGGSPWDVAAAVRDVGRAYRAFEPDLIHAHGAQAGVVARLARSARRETPFIHTPHRYAFEDGSGMSVRNVAYEAVERSLMPLVDRVLCVCNAERAIAERIGAGGRARVVYNGIDPLPAAPIPAECLRFASGGRLIVAVSELFSRKGVEVLLEAMTAIRSAHPDARLIVAGEGPDRLTIERRGHALGLAGHVLFAGHVDGVSGLLETADVYVNPALAEAFPYGVLEAMSAGSPCVVTDAGGTAEAIVDGESGIVVRAGNAAALAQGVGRLLGDRELARGLGEAAERRVRERFTREQMIEGTLSVYAELDVV